MERNPAEECGCLQHSAEGLRSQSIWQLHSFTGQWKEREGVSSGLNHFFYHLKISWAQSQSLHTSLAGTAVERKKTLLSNRAIQVIKNWVVIHKQGLQAAAMHMDLVELNSLYKQIKLHRSCSLLELSRVQCRQRELLILYFCIGSEYIKIDIWDIKNFATLAVF